MSQQNRNQNKTNLSKEQINFTTSVDSLEETVLREEARMYNVPDWVQPTRIQYKFLINLLKGSIALHRLDDKISDSIYKHLVKVNKELDFLRLESKKSIHPTNVLFRFWKFIILK